MPLKSQILLKYADLDSQVFQTMHAHSNADSKILLAWVRRNEIFTGCAQVRSTRRSKTTYGFITGSRHRGSFRRTLPSNSTSVLRGTDWRTIGS
jgi:hypothetical protein